MLTAWRLTALPGWTAIIPWRQVAGLKMMPLCLSSKMSLILNFCTHGPPNCGTWRGVRQEADSYVHPETAFSPWGGMVIDRICSAGTSLIQDTASPNPTHPSTHTRGSAISLRTPKYHWPHLLWRKIKCRCWDSAQGLLSELAGLNVLPAPKAKKDGFILVPWGRVFASSCTANKHQEVACRRRLLL